MKKKYFILVMILGSGLLSSGQVELGYTMGSSLSGLNFRTEDLTLGDNTQGLMHNVARKGQFSMRHAIYGGLVANIKVSNGFLIRVKLIYQEKGWREKGKIDSFSYSTPTSYTADFKETFTLKYCDMPVEFIFLAPAGKTQIYFGAGAYFDYAIAGKFDSHVAGVDSTGFVNFGNTKSPYAYQGNTWDIGASVSFGVIFRIGLSLDFSYLAGVRNVLNDRFFFLYNRNRTFRVGFTYIIFKK